MASSINENVRRFFDDPLFREVRARARMCILYAATVLELILCLETHNHTPPESDHRTIDKALGAGGTAKRKTRCSR